MATVEIKREQKKATDRLRGYKVVVDGKTVGKVGNGETVSFEIAPGHHEIYLKMDWKKSRPLSFSASDDRPTQILAHPTYGVFGGAPGSWITLELTDGLQ